MDYLDRELESYQNTLDATCEVCGEINSDDWRCSCCHDCGNSSCECEDDYENILGV